MPPSFSLITERRPTIADDTRSVPTIFLSVVAFKERFINKKPLKGFRHGVPTFV